MNHLQFQDLRAEEYVTTCSSAPRSSRSASRTSEKYQPLVDRTLAMIFEKASTRTRVSFEAGMYQMGGSVCNLTTGDSQLGRAEPVEDSAQVISRDGRHRDDPHLRAGSSSSASPRTRGCR